MKSPYERMLKLLQAKGKSSNAGRREKWFLYILRCQDGSFYTGVTNDIERRIKMHNSGRASRYTRSRRPVELLYQEKCGSRTRALVRECSVKTYSRPEKEKLIASGKEKKS